MQDRCFFQNPCALKGFQNLSKLNVICLHKGVCSGSRFPHCHKIERQRQTIQEDFLPFSVVIQELHRVSTSGWFHRMDVVSHGWNCCYGVSKIRPRNSLFRGYPSATCPISVLPFWVIGRAKAISDFLFFLSKVPGGSALCRRVCWFICVTVRPGSLPRNLLH